MKNSSEYSYTTKVSEHIPSRCIISSFSGIEHNHYVWRRKDCMNRFCEILREYAMEIINQKKKKMKLLTK